MLSLRAGAPHPSLGPPGPAGPQAPSAPTSLQEGCSSQGAEASLDTGLADVGRRGHRGGQVSALEAAWRWVPPSDRPRRPRAAFFPFLFAKPLGALPPANLGAPGMLP